MSDVWSIDMEEHVESMLNTISQVFGTSGEMQRAILESVAAEFGIDSLPPMYRLESMEEGHGDEERLSEPPARDDEGPETDAALIDTSSTSQVEQSSTGEESMSLSTHSQSPVDQLEGTASDAIFPAMESADTAHRSTAWSILDPTVPEFTPSFPRNNPRSDPGPSYELDWLRPLHPGPDVESLQDAESEDLRPWRAGSSTTIEGILRQIEDIASRRLEEPGPSVDVSSLLLNHPSPDGSTQPAPRTDESLLDPPPTTFDAALAQESDPPFMTDGRGRVVWSSTTSSRSRDGRRGRAASSASLLSHNKSGPDVLQSEDGCSTASRHDSPAQRTLGLPPRLVRQRSLPSVGGNSDIEEACPAEFVTDGRGRVVFAANNHDH
ncbi:hypothetical protein BC628DRAFT_825212 [Trametes gibbosa]|nr:hypothetical protein BC628DRAFT_825212 [Trametes gibbosa]